ncbi:hypothetical protein D9M69_701030 [compost metagenome]
MQIDAVLAEGFAVIGHVDHRARDVVLMLFQQAGNACEHMIGVEDGIVVGVGDFLD